MIPPFDSVTGLLPATSDGSAYVTTPDEVRDIFVDGLGAPQWRQQLFDGWTMLRMAIADFVPTARWWLWGCFISSHAEPLFGDTETISAVVIIPVDDMPTDGHERELVLSFVHSAQAAYRVDVAMVFDHDADDLEALEALEWKYRPRATMGVADHTTRELVPAGFIEVGP